MKVSDAKAKKIADDHYEVSFTVEGKKFYADGKGRETEAPLDEIFEVGLFSAEPGKAGYKTESVLLLERHNFKTGKVQMTLRTASKPLYVGVDPFNKRIDRNSNDNLVKVVMP